MPILKYKSVTPSLRHATFVDKSFLWKGKPNKSLCKGSTRSSGRNNTGHITVRHRGGGSKKLFRFLDNYRSWKGNFIVKRIEHDPNRSAWIALIQSEFGKDSYILSPRGLKPGDVISIGDNERYSTGNVFSMENMPIGSIMHNLEIFPGKGGQLAKSAGTYAQLISRVEDLNLAIVKLPSGEKRYIYLECLASLGSLSNSFLKETFKGKAGRTRWMGIRPSVRGVAMNPIDHPHGGGEGKTSSGRHPVTPWGKLTKGKKTKKRTSQFVVDSKYL